MRISSAVISVRDLDQEATAKLRPLLTSVPGVESVDFNLERSVAFVQFDVDRVKIDDLLRAVLKAGYQVL